MRAGPAALALFIKLPDAVPDASGFGEASARAAATCLPGLS